jgi:hypothetical protein
MITTAAAGTLPADDGRREGGDRQARGASLKCPDISGVWHPRVLACLPLIQRLFSFQHCIDCIHPSSQWLNENHHPGYRTTRPTSMRLADRSHLLNPS